MMDALGAALVVAAVVLAWLAAVLFGRDSRDGRDWPTGTGVRERPPRARD
jgi:hypothetical protein